ncbi:MAG: hypothetical protein ACI855_004080, partial [Myxococcota bacterium]
GDLPSFFLRIEEVTHGVDDPYDALAAAVGVETVED